MGAIRQVHALLIGLFIALASLLAVAQTAFTTPESALAHYIKSVNARDLAGVNATFFRPTPDFSFTNTVPVERFRIVKRIPHTEERAREWDRLGIRSSVAVGDLELHVEETLERKPYMFSYFFRKTPGGWKIVDFVAWDNK